MSVEGPKAKEGDWLSAVKQDKMRKAEKEIRSKWWVAGKARIEPNHGHTLPDGRYTKIMLPDKWTFAGEVKGEILQKGELIWENRNKFIGEFLPNMKMKCGVYLQVCNIKYKVNGQDKTKTVYMEYDDDCMYKQGEIVKGTRKVYEDITRKETWLSTYNGQMKQGKANGYGVYQSPKLHYRGEFVNDLFHGRGKLVILGSTPGKDGSTPGKDGWIMEGEFENGNFASGLHSALKYYEASGGFKAQHRVIFSNNNIAHPIVIPPIISPKPGRPPRETVVKNPSNKGQSSIYRQESDHMQSGFRISKQLGEADPDLPMESPRSKIHTAQPTKDRIRQVKNQQPTPSHLQITEHSRLSIAMDVQDILIDK